ncbi:MAG: peptide chain release factor N(5)-glutamine methyltransferase [Bacillota bacterium]|nr:peptide chain release factor N(5)-glutamine methyltransferase [Bacillota bacterium]
MTIQELLNKGYEILKSENIESYLLDCQLLLGYVLNIDKLSIILNKRNQVSEENENEYLKLVQLRKNKMPVKYILKECEFMNSTFYIEKGVLIPRPDTEILVEEMTRQIKKYMDGAEDIHKICKNYTLCDVCCGSGIIGISLAQIFKNITAYCYDIDDTAEKVTNININRFNLEERVKFCHSDLLEHPINSSLIFDFIVSNPPYIRKNEIPALMEDVKNYEPYIALCGGEDGLDFYRKITSQSHKVLKLGGILCFEIGYDQGKETTEILKNSDFRDVKIFKDLAGNDRVVLGIK